MGAEAESFANPTDLTEAIKRSKSANKTYLICMQVDSFEGWTQKGHSWWK